MQQAVVYRAALTGCSLVWMKQASLVGTWHQGVYWRHSIAQLGFFHRSMSDRSDAADTSAVSEDSGEVDARVQQEVGTQENGRLPEVGRRTEHRWQEIRAHGGLERGSARQTVGLGAGEGGGSEDNNLRAFLRP